MKKWIGLLILLAVLMIPQGSIKAEEPAGTSVGTSIAQGTNETSYNTGVAPELLREAATELEMSPEALAKSVTTSEDIYKMLCTKKLPQITGVPIRNDIVMMDLDMPKKDVTLSEEREVEESLKDDTSVSESIKPKKTTNNFLGMNAFAMKPAKNTMVVAAGLSPMMSNDVSATSKEESATTTPKKTAQQVAKNNNSQERLPWTVAFIVVGLMIVGTVGVKKRK